MNKRHKKSQTRHIRVGLGLKMSLAFGAAALIFGLSVIPALGQLEHLRRVQVESQDRATGVRALLEINILSRNEALAVSALLLQSTNGDNSQIVQFREAAAAKKVWQAAANAVAQTDQEKAWFAQLKDADMAFEDNFNNQLVPAIQNNDSEAITNSRLLSDGYLGRVKRLSEQIIDSYLHNERLAAQTLDATAATTVWLVGLFVVVGTVLHIIFIILISRSILRPLTSLNNGTRSVARGDLTTTPNVETNDEVGDLAANFGRMVASLRGVVAQVQREAGLIETESRHITRVSQAQVEGSTQQREAVFAISTMVMQLSARTGDIAEAAERVARVAQDAYNSTQVGQKAVTAVVSGLVTIRERANETTQRTNAVNRSLQQVSAILDVINEIAEETHLLAVNATIEASGAGTYGRRFGVVAQEVGSLSDRSKAASLIAVRIINDLKNSGTASVEAAHHNMVEIERGAVLVERNAAAIDEIIALTDRLAQLSDAIHQATQAQREAARLSVEMARNIGEVAERMESQSAQSAQAARSLSSIAAQLHHSTNAFHIAPDLSLPPDTFPPLTDMLPVLMPSSEQVLV